MAESHRYRHTGLVLVRASTAPEGLDKPPPLSVTDPATVIREGMAWLTGLWARPEVREALSLASPDLGARIDTFMEQTQSDLRPDTSGQRAKRVRHTVATVASYLLRWQRRATPFGLFAGVTTATVGPAVALVGSWHRATVRADADWITTLANQLERHSWLRQRLTVLADNTAVVRDGRVVVHRRPETGAVDAGPLCEVSLLATRPVRAALEGAAAPIRFDALATALTDLFELTASERITKLLNRMVDAGVLITSLRLPMSKTDPLSHLLAQLRDAGASEHPDTAALMAGLERINADMLNHNNLSDPKEARRARIMLAARMRALADTGSHPLAVDTRLDATISIPESILTEAARAADALLITTSQPFGSMVWLDYHARFRAHYGVGTLVPVRDLVADSGLGYPTGYLGAPRAHPAWRALTDRDATLLALIQRAALDGATEISLTDADVESLTVGDHSGVVVPQRVEIGVSVHAISSAALDRGEFELRVTATPGVPTSMAGRFADLLGSPGRAHLAATYATSGCDEALPVQLSFPPRRTHNQNVVRVPALMPTLVALSEHPDPTAATVEVDDLAVTADAEQMYLVQRSTGRRVVPHIPHALDTGMQTPPLARFLAEVAEARSAVFRGFDLGAARILPYVPAIRYRRTVLMPAQWLLTIEDLHAVSAAEQKTLAAWRRRWRVPARVIACHGELRLPLDLDGPLDQALLLTQLRRAGRLQIQADASADGQQWIGRAAELLIPLTAAHPAARPLPLTSAPISVLRPGAADLLHARWTGNPARFDEILTGGLTTLLKTLHVEGLTGLWWVRRHRDLVRPESDQYLSIVVRLTSPDCYGPVATRLAAFTADLETRGLACLLTLVSHPQHSVRHGPVIERVLAADTVAAIAQLDTAHRIGIGTQILAATSMALLGSAFASDPHSGHRALLACLPQQHGVLDRTLRDNTLRLSDPADNYAAVRALPGGETLAAAWARRSEALADYHRVVHGSAASELRALLHDHHGRAVGIDPAVEDETNRLARAVALRHLHLVSVGTR